MAAVFVCNVQDGLVERYFCGYDDPMPYISDDTLTVGEFVSHACVETVWTDSDTMRAFSALRGLYGRPIRIVRGFVDPARADTACRPQHLFGTALVISPADGAGSLGELYDAAVSCDAFAALEPFPQSGTVYLDVRYRPSGYFVGSGLPNLMRGKRGNHVMMLQRCLGLYGFGEVELDGVFGRATESAVKRMQQRVFLTPDGVVGGAEWRCILNHACF